MIYFINREGIMVIVLKKDISESDKDNLREFLTSKNFKLNEVVGEEETRRLSTSYA